MTDATEAPVLNRRQIGKQETAAKLLAEARLQFARDGFEAATIRSIATAVKMSTGAIFANFKDKEVLYVEAMGHKPITPEQGRDAMIALRALAVDLNPTGQSDLIDQVNAIEYLRVYAVEILDRAGFPELPAEQQRNPDETNLGEVIQAAMGREA